MKRILLILGFMIVIVIVIWSFPRLFGGGDAAVRDAVQQDLIRIAIQAQEYYQKPRIVGGGGRSFEGFSFQDFNVRGTLSSDGFTLTNDNGEYVLPEVPADAEQFIVTAFANDAGRTEMQIRICIDSMVIGEEGEEPGEC